MQKLSIPPKHKSKKQKVKQNKKVRVKPKSNSYWKLNSLKIFKVSIEIFNCL